MTPKSQQQRKIDKLYFIKLVDQDKNSNNTTKVAINLKECDQIQEVFKEQH